LEEDTPPVGGVDQQSAATTPSAVRRARPIVIADSARAAGSSNEFAWRILQIVKAIPEGAINKTNLSCVVRSFSVFI